MDPSWVMIASLAGHSASQFKNPSRNRPADMNGGSTYWWKMMGSFIYWFMK